MELMSWITGESGKEFKAKLVKSISKSWKNKGGSEKIKVAEKIKVDSTTNY